MPMDQDASGRFDAWGLSTERSPLTSTITDDDILEMVQLSYLDLKKHYEEKEQEIFFAFFGYMKQKNLHALAA